MSEIKLPAASGGGSISIKGPASSGSDVDLLDTSGNLKLSDSDELRLGTGDDLKLYHDGSNSYIRNNVGDLVMYTVGTENVTIKTNSEKAIDCIPDGAVELYHNNVKKFETSADGVTVSAAEIKLQNSAAANATVQIIAGEGGDAILELLSDEADDNGDKWKLQADDNHSFYLQNKTSGSWETSIMATGNGGIYLNYDNSTKLTTTSAGGTLDGVWDINNGLKFYDTIEARFGTGEDLKIFHNGSHSIIQNNEGNLYIWGADGHDGNIVIQATYGEESIICEHNGWVRLYYNNNLRLSTTDVGIDVFEAYGNVVGGSIRDLYIRNDGRLGYDSSVRASKVNIADLTDVSWLDDLKPKTFNKKKQDDTGAFTSEHYSQLEYGLIAEEVETVNKELCSYSDTDELEAVHYKKLITPILKALQDARVEITTLKTKVAALEAG